MPAKRTTGHAVQDEGTTLAQAHFLNFMGSAVSVATSGGVTTVTITGGIPETILDAKGDLIAASAADTAARLAVGTDGQLLSAASAQATGLAWANTPLKKLFDSTLGGDAANIDTGANGIASGYDVLEIWFFGRTTEAVVGSTTLWTLNNDTGNNYDHVQVRAVNATALGSNALAQANWALATFGANAQSGACTLIRMTIPGYTQTTFHKVAEMTMEQVEDTAADARTQLSGLRYRSTTAVSRLTVTAGSGNLLAGSRLLIYGR